MLWSRDTFLEELQKYKVIKKVCRLYSETEDGWFKYYTDVWRWRKQDPEFDAKVKAIQKENGLLKSGGRKRLDNGDKSWHEDFCAALYEHDGNRAKAALVTPYSLRQIQEMLDPGSSSYDEEFNKKVGEVIFKISSELEEMFLNLRHDRNFRTFEDAKIAQTKGWIAIKGLEKLDPVRWGRRSELHVEGGITHLHKVERVKSREELLAELWEDKDRFMQARKTQLVLESGQPISMDIGKKEEPIEVEVVDRREE